jgi:hypothetical protein
LSPFWFEALVRRGREPHTRLRRRKLRSLAQILRKGCRPSPIFAGAEVGTASGWFQPVTVEALGALVAAGPLPAAVAGAVRKTTEYVAKETRNQELVVCVHIG